MEENLPGLIFMYLCMGTLALVVLTAVFASVLWAINDAKERGQSPLWVALLVILVSWPLGLIIWLALRPKKNSATS